MNRDDPRTTRDAEVALTDAVWRVAQARRRHFASSLVADSSKASTSSVARLHTLRRRVVSAGTVTAVEAELIVSSAAKIAGVPLELLADEIDLRAEETRPPPKRPIVDLVAHVLQREGRCLRTHELIAFLAEGGRRVVGANPSSSIRSSIFARRDKSPVVLVSPGLWKLREWSDDVKRERLA